MKAKKIVPENSEQPKTLPAPSNEERTDQLAGWQKQIVALAEARLSIDGEQDVIFHMQQRAISLCRVVDDLTINASDSDEVSLRALGRLMEVIEEHIQIAQWITAGKPLCSHWD